MRRAFTLRANGEVLESYGSLRAVIRAGIRFEQPPATSDYLVLEAWEGDELIGDPNELWAESGGTGGMFR